MSQSAFKIGVDGGGTKTELILVDAAGTIVASHFAPGCNPSHCGPVNASSILTEALVALVQNAKALGFKPTISTTQLYVAGAPAFWNDFTSSLQGYGKASAGPDSLPVLELATDGKPGLVLHAGTGSFVAARSRDDSIHYAGGLGWKLGDAGSGFDLGRRGVALALLELQGWAPISPLSAALQKHTGLTEARELTRFFYAEPDANARIATFAPQIVELAAQHCLPAQVILSGSLTELVALAQQVSHKLFGATLVPCGISGAILNSLPAAKTLKALAEASQWPIEFRFITEPPIEGVRRLLLANR